ncbi:MAG: hypothetical protein IT374_28255 [Polyangiaceae bacterium]|nr:hypothetical protein [Polyangiaceae bacterium]
MIATNLGELFIGEIRTSDILAWKAAMAKQISSGAIKPSTANTQLSVLKVILKHARLDLGLRETSPPISPASTRRASARTATRNRTR